MFNEVPPVETSYQLIIPADAFAFSNTVPASHRNPEVVEVIIGLAFIVAIIAVLGLVQNVVVAST